MPPLARRYAVFCNEKASLKTIRIRDHFCRNTAAWYGTSCRPSSELKTSICSPSRYSRNCSKYWEKRNLTSKKKKPEQGCLVARWQASRLTTCTMHPKSTNGVKPLYLAPHISSILQYLSSYCIVPSFYSHQSYVLLTAEPRHFSPGGWNRDQEVSPSFSPASIVTVGATTPSPVRAGRKGGPRCQLWIAKIV